ncbi:MAG TPA: thiamine phosphate synthase [Thermodesulfovibrionales bacterium]|nr:thiamine phosphate synthase [Thermodesulfovibrionales bacterium]
MKRNRSLNRVLPFLGGLCLVTDRKFCGLSCEELSRIALEAGVRWIQYREKEKTRREIYYEARKLRSLTSEYGATLVVNDHADIALAVDADGVHLGQDDLPLKEARRIVGRRLIGISTHTLTQAKEAEQDGADYIGFGPVFFTATKDAGEPRGVEMLSLIRESVEIPVVAIGGISAETFSLVWEAGADAVAVASAVLRGNISENVRLFMRVLGNE